MTQEKKPLIRKPIPVHPPQTKQRVTTPAAEAIKQARQNAPVNLPANNLTPEENAELAELDYSGDGPVPASVTAKISEAKAEFARIERMQPHKVSVADLPEEKKAELREAMRKAQVEDNAKAAINNLPPELRKAAEAAYQSSPGLSGVTGRPPVSGVKVFKSAKPPAQLNKKEEPTATVAADPEPESAVDVRSDELPLGMGTQLTQCPHCNWNLALPSPVEPEQDEIVAFATATLLGQQFTKSYAIMAGRAQLIFRDPPAKLNDLVQSQLAKDRKDESIITLDDFWRYTWNYRTLVRLHQVVLDNEVLEISRLVDDTVNEFAGAGVRTDTGLPQALNALLTADGFSSSLWAMSVSACRQFFDLVSVLEARAQDPNFYRAIVD